MKNLMIAAVLTTIVLSGCSDGENIITTEQDIKTNNSVLPADAWNDAEPLKMSFGRVRYLLIRYDDPNQNVRFYGSQRGDPLPHVGETFVYEIPRAPKEDILLRYKRRDMNSPAWFWYQYSVTETPDEDLWTEWEFHWPPRE